MPIQFTNNATSLLAYPVLAGDGTVTIEAGDVWMFPPASVSAGAYFYATIEDRRLVPTVREIVRVIDRSGAVFSILRGQDSTAARDFFTGAIFSHRLNAAALRAVIQEEADARIAADNAEAAARIAADNNLQTQITAEVNARIAGDSSLQSQINAEINRAETAEANLQSQITTLSGTSATHDDLAAEVARAEAAETALGVRIDNEINDRTNNDNYLQSEIDAINTEIGALPGPVSFSIQSGTAVTDSTGHRRVTFATPFSTYPAVTISNAASTYNILSEVVQADPTGFDAWFAFPLSTGVTPAGVTTFYWIAAGS